LPFDRFYINLFQRKMPYTPINKCGLPKNVDIRLQHRFSAIGKNLSHKTKFNKIESLRLLQMHYMLTEENGNMDILRFVQFMDVFLGVKNVEAIEKVHLISCKTNNKYLTGPEFVSVLSLLLKGTVSDLVKFWFEIYTDNIRPNYEHGVLEMVKANISEDVRKPNIDYVMYINKKIISPEDHRKYVNDIITGLELLRSVLPVPTKKVLFMLLFTNRMFYNNNLNYDIEISRGFDLSKLIRMQTKISKVITLLAPSKS